MADMHEIVLPSLSLPVHGQTGGQGSLAMEWGMEKLLRSDS